jgi:hypothetical protein
MLNRLLFLFVLTLVGCGTSERETLMQFREAFATGEFAKARTLLKKAGLEKQKNSQLLLLMERGRLNYSEGLYQDAVKDFNQAVELIDAQYTKSFTREGSKWIVNDRSGEFFGSPYERSWLFYHQAMAYWKLYQSGVGDDPRRNLFSARAALLAWDSFFQEWIRATDGKTVYRHDLAAKVVAAQVHEATGIRADIQIALQLYKDGFKLLNTLSPSYAAFNTKSSDYAEKLGLALADKGEFKPPQKLDDPTPINASTRDYLIEKIVHLTQATRPSDLSLFPKQLGITQEEIKKAQKLKQGRVVFILEEGVMPPKIHQQISLGIKGLAKLSKDPKTQAQIARVGSEVMAIFAVNVLGLVPKRNATYGNYHGAHALMTVAAHEAAIEFEVPAIEKGKLPEEIWISLKNSKGEVSYRPWNVLTHLEDVASQALAEESTQRIFRTGVRVAMKHIAAIIGAMAIYKSMSKGEKDNLFAKYAALGSYLAATKGISYSERADTRAWLTLPRTLRMGEFDVGEGEYTVEMVQKTDQNSWKTLKALGVVNVGKDRAIFTYLMPQI